MLKRSLYAIKSKQIINFIGLFKFSTWTNVTDVIYDSYYELVQY